MKGYRFYADLPGANEEETGKRLLPRRATVKLIRLYAESGNKLNCIALELDGSNRPARFATGSRLVGCVAAVYNHQNSAATYTEASLEFVRKCKRIPEKLARQLHPQLFEYLDSD